MKFNRTKSAAKRPNMINFAGGQAHGISAKHELISILLTSFLQDQFYRRGDATANRLSQLVASIPDKRFVAKAALYARKEAGMRSVSHLVAGELAQTVKGEEWTKAFYDRVVHRADDVTEILAYTLAVHGRPVPNALKKGLGMALARFDAHQLAKYRREKAALKLVDAVNLVHPPHTEAIGALVDGSLAPAQTWETKLSQAGQEAESDKEKSELKLAAWTELIVNRKIGYFALLRNLRNLIEQAPGLVDSIIPILTDRTMIRRSLVMPFRFRSALDAVEAMATAPRPVRQKVIRGLNRAVDLSLENIPAFRGDTLIAMDCSGSMIGKPMKVGSLFAAALYKSTRADLMLFSNEARFECFNASDSTLSIAQRIEGKAEWNGTNFHSIFRRADRAYDRIVILSDMQAWIGHWTPRAEMDHYVNRVGKRPRIFSFDLAGYGSLQFPEADVYALAGFSEKTLEVMRFLEEDKSALIRRIEAIDL
ncbi:MAG: TROVE domain-containing protein [Verrucomicrobiota bacterium]